jgi:cytochrome b561
MPQYYISPPPVSPLGRIVASVLAVAAVVGALVFGFFILAVAVAVGFLVWISFAVRGWWRRKNRPAKPEQSEPRHGQVIETEYTVISRRRE